MAYQLQAQDDYYDTSGTALADHGPELGGLWQQLSGAHTTVSNQLGSASAAFALNLTPLAAKQKVQIRLDNAAAVVGVGCRCEWDGSNLTGYYARAKTTPNSGFELLKFTGSGFSTSTLDNTSSTTSATSDVLAIEANGSTINVYKNGSLEFTVGDGSYGSGHALVGCDGSAALAEFKAYDETTPSGIYLINSSWKGLGVNGGTTEAFSSVGCDFMVVVVSDYAGGGTDTLSDSEGNTWNARTARTNGTARVRIYDCFAPNTDAAHTVTMTGSGVYVGVAALCFVNVDSFEQESGAGAAQPGSLTPSEDGCLLIAGVCDSAEARSHTIDSSFRLGGQRYYIEAHNLGVAAAYQIQTSATARNPTFSRSGGSGDIAAAMAVYTSSDVEPAPTSLPLIVHHLQSQGIM